MSTTAPKHSIEIEVDCNYVEEKSSPEQHRYLFSYAITIRNTGSAPAKLLKRHWVITDANQKIQEVVGDGVVGKQPYLKPGETHHYSSAAIIETPVGTMRGSYLMIDDDEIEFEAPVDQFVLSIPRTLH